MDINVFSDEQTDVWQLNNNCVNNTIISIMKGVVYIVGYEKECYSQVRIVITITIQFPDIGLFV